MCGIAGLVTAPGRAPDRDLLRRMTDTLRRRGPDDLGLEVDAEGGCGLGHRRLSIIDLEHGHQPLSTRDGRLHAVVNGEIYNFVELRAILEAAGHSFATRSDSEVVLHGYREWGEAMVARLEGMFAFAVWDADARRLLLGRDRMGQKPLYFARVGPTRSPTLVFGSEAKALFAHPEVSRQPSPRGLAQYLTYECVPEAECLTEGMEKVLPGEFVVYERASGRLRRERYWDLRFAASPAAPELRGQDEPGLVKLLRERIEESVEARLVADVPLGVLLSGGIDSSAVAGAMTRWVSPGSIKTFSVAFEDPSFDESSHARRVAEHLGTDHHEERLSPAVMLDILPQVADFMCEPIGDASVIPTHLLSRFARREVTVALGGDGGDELFLGYPTFPADRVARALDRLLPLGVERGLGQLALAAAGWLPVSRKNFSFDFKVKRFAQGLGFSPDERHQAWLGSFLPAELGRILRPEVAEAALAESPYATIARVLEGTDARDGLDRASLQYARTYLAGDVLVKVDRASMACGLEVRAPLLDRRVVELAAALPSHWKLRGHTTKYLLKEAARPWLPPGIVDRPKKGFGVPVADWIRGPLRPLAKDLLAEDRLAREGFFVPGEVTRLLTEHLDGRADHRKPLWTLMAFELWMDRHGPGGQG
jgi:asparagine synthase (glutamine-hydrolysing)